MRVALLSNVTADLLASELGEAYEAWLCPGFDTWQAEVRDPLSGLYAFGPEAVVVMLHAGGNPLTGAGQGDVPVGEWLVSVRALAEALPATPVLVSTLDAPSPPWDAGPGDDAARRFAEGIRALHAEGLRTYPLAVGEEAARVGRESFYSPKMWYVGAMPWSAEGVRRLAGLIRNHLDALRRPPLKCLVTDLDGTLWGGVIGEDGTEGILLSRTGRGSVYRDAQLELRAMRRHGAMLAVLSKNNPTDVEAAFTHPDMVLGHGDFVAEEVGWGPKPDGMRRLAERLNIGLDAMAFLDDNPAERGRMAEELPEVTVLDFPRDASRLPEAIADAYREHFLALEVTEEDRAKTEMYRAEASRREARSTSSSVGEWLSALGMSMDAHLLREGELPRAAQLAGKTNQFNTTTVRYTEPELAALAASPDSDVVAVRMADRYGDQGLAALAVLSYAGGTATVDDFLMSCRVMGRWAEVEIAARVRGLLEARGVRRVRADYVRSAKNEPVADLWGRLGLAARGGPAREVGDSCTYEGDVFALPEGTGLFAGPAGVAK